MVRGQDDEFMNRLWDVITDRYIQRRHSTASDEVLDCLMPDGPQSNFSRRDIYDSILLHTAPNSSIKLYVYSH